MMTVSQVLDWLRTRPQEAVIMVRDDEMGLVHVAPDPNRPHGATLVMNAPALFHNSDFAAWLAEQPRAARLTIKDPDTGWLLDVEPRRSVGRQIILRITGVMLAWDEPATADVPLAPIEDALARLARAS